MKEKNILWFSEIGKEDVLQVGGKGANLGEMTGIGMPVPPGFVITAKAYRDFLTQNKLQSKIDAILTNLDVDSSQKLNTAAKKVQSLIRNSPVPQNIANEIVASYLELNKKIHTEGSAMAKFAKLFKNGELQVAVRSSATSEDSKEASFAGQNRTLLNISGEANLVEAVRDCWASLFEARSIFYRVQNHFDHFTSYIAVVVQAMIPSEISGILFSIDPVTNNRDRVVIEAIWGLGEYIVLGKVTPDHYEVAKSDLTIVETKVTPQKIMLSRIKIGTKQQSVPKQKINKQKISAKNIKDLAKLSLALEKHYYFPQDSEFAIFADKIYLVQTRPITTIAQTQLTKNLTVVQKKSEDKMELLLQGAPASPGIKSGPVRILRNSKEIDKIKPGEILVASQTDPDYVPAMKKALAIVTDRGGRTSHAAIVSRELGIPCVVGTSLATQKLKDGMVITVNGSEGRVYLGALDLRIDNEPVPTKSKLTPSPDPRSLKTATKVYVNLAEPDQAKQIAARNCDGVGLLRAEFMLAGIGVHPKEIIKEHKEKAYIQTLTEQLTTFAEAFYPRPVVYRATDFKTNEYRSLKGGDLYEPHEENPMIGFRGAYRYLIQPEVFKLELEAIKRVRNENGFKNLWLMIPFCRTVPELEEVKAIIHNQGLQRSPTFKLWLMCEIPSNVILLDKFLEVGIDGISVGSNDLTMLTLGVDRDNENVASQYDERNPAVLHSFYKIIRTCVKYGVTCSMCGQAPSDYPDLTEKLVKWGITSVSVNPDVLNHTREVVYEAEKKLISQ